MIKCIIIITSNLTFGQIVDSEMKYLRNVTFTIFLRYRPLVLFLWRQIKKKKTNLLHCRPRSPVGILLLLKSNLSITSWKNLNYTRAVRTHLNIFKTEPILIPWTNYICNYSMLLSAVCDDWPKKTILYSRLCS